ncbi:MAG TPA: ATP-binding protein [Thermoanaerobaculia bacterium]|nr:ATP-binding protein [Thermoanaerobaculia bacterium]
MRPRLLLLILASAAALLAFAYVVRQLSFVSVGLAANADSRRVLSRSLEDQKRLAHLDPEHSAEYRARFEETRTLMKRIEILALTRRELTRHLELLLLAVVAAIVFGGGIVYLAEQRNRERRLARLGTALQALSRGETPVAPADGRRDLIGRIGAMVEETSRTIDRSQKRVQYLEHLSAWQEAARRHAHEIRTPLTAAQMEVGRLVRTAADRLPESRDELAQLEASILEELDRLRTFTTNFVAFAAVGAPRLQLQDLAAIVEEFCIVFAPNWPRLALVFEAPAARCCAKVDRAMLRQVLVNLCNNSALAAADRNATVRFSLRRNGDAIALDVADDGPGFPEELRRRLFEPYTTTRKVGEGMGLGLAISKKILLDHGGDLELVEAPAGAPLGATFRLTLPAVECGA